MRKIDFYGFLPQHVFEPGGRTDGPQKSFQGGTFETGGFIICPTSKNVNTPFKVKKICAGGGICDISYFILGVL